MSEGIVVADQRVTGFLLENDAGNRSGPRARSIINNLDLTLIVDLSTSIRKIKKATFAA